MDPQDVLGASYGELLRVVTDLDEDAGSRSTRCSGWTARDVVAHLLTDAQRALVALHTTAPGPADVDAVTYWRNWQPGTPAADASRRGTRIFTSIWSSLRPLIHLYDETAQAVLAAARERSGTELLATQGHVLTAADLLSTLAVEATVHQLDLRLGVPSELGLAEVRRVLDGLLGRPAPIDDTVRYVLVGTGREAPSDDERALLGAEACERLPLFG